MIIVKVFGSNGSDQQIEWKAAMEPHGWSTETRVNGSTGSDAEEIGSGFRKRADPSGFF